MASRTAGPLGSSPDRSPARGTRGTRSRCPGFSLVELLVALVILSTAVVALVRVFTVSLAGSARAGDQTTASFLARQLVEEARAETSLIAGTETGAFEGDLERFAWSREIQKLAGVPRAGERSGLYRLDATVSWRDRGIERSVRLTALVYKNP